MNWNDKTIEKMYNRIKKEAQERGIPEERLLSPYLNKLSKETKSPRILKMIEEAYYLGMLRGIHYVDEMKTPIFLRDLEISTIPNEDSLFLIDVEKKGNVLLLHFENSETNEIIRQEFALDFECYVLDYADIEYSYSQAKTSKCPLLVVNPTIKEETWWPEDDLVLNSKNSVFFFYGDSCKNVLNKLESFKFKPKPFPADLKIIDFKKQGNQVKFFLGDLNCNDYWGDDWNDCPYECNAGSVYDRYVKEEWIVSFPYDYYVFEPSEGFDNSPFSKESMKTMDVPCIVYAENMLDYWLDFKSLSLLKNSHKIYFNDTKETIDF